MDVYIAEKYLSAHHKMSVCDEKGNPIYQISGKVISVGRKEFIADMQGNELLYLHQKVLAFTPHYVLEKNGEEIAEVDRKLGLHKNFVIKGLNWTVEGDLGGHEYTGLDSEGQAVFTVKNKWFEWGDTYHLWVRDDIDVVTCIGIVVAFDISEDEQQAGEAGAIGDTIGGLLSHS